MSVDREAQFKKLVADFPSSPMGHFSLGKLYLEGRKYLEAIAALTEAVRLDPQYAAGLLALGAANEGAGRPEDAILAYEQARDAALAQHHPTLADEAEEHLHELRGG